MDEGLSFGETPEVYTSRPNAKSKIEQPPRVFSRR